MFSRKPKLVSLSDIGQIVNISINNIFRYYPNTKIDKYIVILNHVYIIIVSEFDDARHTNENW